MESLPHQGMVHTHLLLRHVCHNEDNATQIHTLSNSNYYDASGDGIYINCV